MLKIDHYQSIGQTFDSTNISVPLNETSVDLTIPIQSESLSKNRIVLLSGLSLDQCNVRLNPGSTMTTFYGTMLKIGIVKNHGTHWKGTYLVLPKIYSDFKSIGKNDLQIGAIGILKYEKSATLNYRVGAYFNTDLYGPFIVPIFGIYLLKNRLEINANLPLTADINYRLADYAKFGIRYSGFSKSYHLNTALPTYVEKATNEIGPYVQFKIGIAHIQLFAGTSFLRNFRTFSVGDKTTATFPLYKLGNNRTQFNTDFGNGTILKCALIFRIPTS